MTVFPSPGTSGPPDMYPTLSGRPTEKERILHWERCLVSLWKIPEPPEGWKKALELRDAAGVTKYG